MRVKKGGGYVVFSYEYYQCSFGRIQHVICGILIGYQLFHMDTYKKQKQWFCFMLLANILMMLGDITDWLFNGVETPAAFFSGTVRHVPLLWIFRLAAADAYRVFD